MPLYLQTAARGIGVINGLDASFHPFIGFPGYKEIAALPLAQRAAALREPARKALILSQKSEPLAGDGTPVPPLVDILLARIELISGRMFPLCTAQQPVPDYEPDVRKSFLVQARQRGVSALEALYDYLAEGDGRQPDLLPDLQLQRRLARRGAADAGAPARAVRAERFGRARGHGVRRQLHHLHAHALGARPRQGTPGPGARGGDADEPQCPLPGAAATAA